MGWGVALVREPRGLGTVGFSGPPAVMPRAPG